MSNRITITLTLDIPDGLTPDITYGDVPQEPADLFVPPPPVYDPVELVRPLAVASAPGCPQHGAMTRYPAGTNKAGKPYNASWRCAAKDCPTKPIWDRDAA